MKWIVFLNVNLKVNKIQVFQNYSRPFRHKLFAANTAFCLNFTRILITFHKFLFIIFRWKLQSRAAQHHLPTRSPERRLAVDCLPVPSVPGQGRRQRKLFGSSTLAVKASHLACSQHRLRHRQTSPSHSPLVRGSCKGRGQLRCPMRQLRAGGTSFWPICIGQTLPCHRILWHRTLPPSPPKFVTFWGGTWKGRWKLWWQNSPRTK